MGFEHYPRHDEFLIGVNPATYYNAGGTPGPVPSPGPSKVFAFQVPTLLSDKIIKTLPAPQSPVAFPANNTLYQTPLDIRLPLLVSLENFGLAAYDFTVRQSNDNGNTDAYAGIALRYNGANIAGGTPLTVQPGAKVVLSIETITKPFFAGFAVVTTAGQAAPYGRAVVTHYNGRFVKVQDLLIPFE